MRFLNIIGLVLLLSGCSFFSPVNTNMEQYRIIKVPANIKHKSHRYYSLLVSQPQAVSVLNTSDMMYIKKPFGVAFFAKHRWADTPSQMLQPLLVQTMQNTHYFHAVGISQSMVRYNYVLNTEILTFQQRFYPKYSAFQMRLRAEIVNANTGKIISSKQFEVEKGAPIYGPYGGVIAANCATATILQQLAAWMMRVMPGT